MIRTIVATCLCVSYAAPTVLAQNRSTIVETATAMNSARRERAEAEIELAATSLEAVEELVRSGTASHGEKQRYERSLEQLQAIRAKIDSEEALIRKASASFGDRTDTETNTASHLWIPAPLQASDSQRYMFQLASTDAIKDIADQLYAAIADSRGEADVFLAQVDYLRSFIDRLKQTVVELSLERLN